MSDTGTTRRSKDWLERALVRRSTSTIEELAHRASREVIANALEQQTGASTLARFLSDVAADTGLGLADPLAPARARAAGVKQQLIDAAGGTYTTEEVARILGIQRQAVTKRERNGQLLAVQGSAGQNLYPRCQFDANGVIPGFEEVLEVLPMENPWTRLSGLLAETPALAGRSILDAVRDGDLDEAIAVAQTLGEHGS